MARKSRKNPIGVRSLGRQLPDNEFFADENFLHDNSAYKGSKLSSKKGGVESLYSEEYRLSYKGSKLSSKKGKVEWLYSEEWLREPRYRTTYRSCKSPKSKSNKGPACAPSTSPSFSPTVSAVPTSSPSDFPTPAPTKVPSARPSVQPTLSISPSTSPSRQPSKNPTDQPSAIPSGTPTLSTIPSVAPTDLPSHSPSQAPSTPPSATPSLSPSATPTTSTEPSPSPSLAPSVTPSYIPSQIPSLSNAPTDIRFVTEGSSGITSNSTNSTGLENGPDWVSTCEEGPPAGGGTTEVQTLVFTYNVYLVPDADAEAAMQGMETSMHFGMANKFLDCDYTDPSGNGFVIVSIDSKPQDEFLETACDTSNDPTPEGETVCQVVQAEMSMVAYFSMRRDLRRETDADVAVLDAIADYLGTSMASGDLSSDNEEIVQVAFQGFTNVEQDRESPPVTAVIDGEPLQPSNENSRMVVGSSVVALAIVALIVISVLSVRRRRGRQEAYLRHLGDLSVASELSESGKHELDRDPYALGDDGMVEVAYEEGDDVMADTDSLDRVIEDLREQERDLYGHDHDVHACASATCPVCRNRDIHPTFVSASLGDGDIADLRQKVFSPDARKKYGSPDTVDL